MNGSSFSSGRLDSLMFPSVRHGSWKWPRTSPSSAAARCSSPSPCSSRDISPLSANMGAMWLVVFAVGGGGAAEHGDEARIREGRPDLVPHLVAVTSPSFPAVTPCCRRHHVSHPGSPPRTLCHEAPDESVPAHRGALRHFRGGQQPRSIWASTTRGDVVAGWCAGLVWALVCWLVARYLQVSRHRRQNGPSVRSRTLTRLRGVVQDMLPPPHRSAAYSISGVGPGGSPRCSETATMPRWSASIRRSGCSLNALLRRTVRHTSSPRTRRGAAGSRKRGSGVSLDGLSSSASRPRECRDRPCRVAERPRLRAQPHARDGTGIRVHAVLPRSPGLRPGRGCPLAMASWPPSPPTASRRQRTGW